MSVFIQYPASSNQHREAPPEKAVFNLVGLRRRLASISNNTNDVVIARISISGVNDCRIYSLREGPCLYEKDHVEVPEGHIKLRKMQF